jgi:hypothetical protein
VKSKHLQSFGKGSRSLLSFSNAKDNLGSATTLTVSRLNGVENLGLGDIVRLI